MTIEQLQTRLREAYTRIGREGRFSFTIGQDAAETCYITHWVRPTPYAFEDCRAVGSGNVNACLKALERYVRTYRQGLPKPEEARSQADEAISGAIPLSDKKHRELQAR